MNHVLLLLIFIIKYLVDVLKVAVIVVLGNVILQDGNDGYVKSRMVAIKVDAAKIFHLWWHVGQGNFIDRRHFLTSAHLGFTILNLLHLLYLF